MAHPILMPKPGQATEECTLVAWHAGEGDPVHRGDVLFEIETDKANMDVEAFDDGVLLRRCVADGATVPVNTVCGYVGTPGEVLPEEVEPAARPPLPVVPVVPVVPPIQPAPAAMVPRPVAPTVRPPTGRAAGGRVRISPRASRLAAEAGLDPGTVAGSGPDGRIVERDIRAAIAAAAPTAAEPPKPALPAALPGEDAPVPLSRMRRVIADRLTGSWTSTPHFTLTVAVDVSGLLALRGELKALGRAITVTDFVLAATAQALVEFPDVNARTDGVSVWRHRRVHLGFAVSLPTGLVVPVIRDADWLSVAEIHDRAVALAEAARDGSLSVDDMTGSTFTVSNLGMYEVEEFSAIINPGEAAILAVSSAIDTPVVVEGGFAIRSVMRLTLSADHRIVDGATGARFVNAIRRRLEDVVSLRDAARDA